MKSYSLHRAGGGLLATHVALVCAGVVARPLLAVDTGSLYTIIEPKFIAALGLDIANPVDFVSISGIGGSLQASSFVIERLHCFGQRLSGIRVLALDFSHILPTINGVLGLNRTTRDWHGHICTSTVPDTMGPALVGAYGHTPLRTVSARVYECHVV